MRRCTDAISSVFPKNMESFETYCYEKSQEHGVELTPEKILEWSSDFGTVLHKWCLEGIEPDNVTDLLKTCKGHWDSFIKENGVKIIKTEQKVLYKNLYHGTYDAHGEMDGLDVQIDLKTWGCWFWELLPQEAPKKMKENASKLSTTNLQTFMYDKATDQNFDARSVVSINPLGYQFKVFTTSPKKKFDKIIEFLEKEDADINF